MPRDRISAPHALGRHQSDEAHELLRARDTREVADLSRDPERGQRLDATQATELCDQLGPRPLPGQRRDLPLERDDARVDQVERVQVVVGGELQRTELEACGVRKFSFVMQFRTGSSRLTSRLLSGAGCT